VIGVFAAAALVLALPFPCHAADDRAACFESYERSQKLRQANDLLSARRELLRCQDKCIPRFANDCQSWRGEIEGVLASMVVEVKAADGKALAVETLLVDGQRIEAPGEPVWLMPGDHVVLAHTAAGESEVKVTLRSQDHDRKVSVTIAAPATAPTATATEPVREAPPADAEPAPRSRVPSYALASGGAVALLGGGTLVLLGNLERSRLESDCSPNCTREDGDRVRTMWIAGAGLAGLGVGALVAAFLLWPRDAKPKAPVSLQLGFGTVGLSGTL